MGFSAVSRFGVIASGLLGALTLASGANAAVTISSIALDTPGGVSGTITYTPTTPDYVVNAGIGRLKLTTDTGDTLLSYCIDIFHSLTAASFTPATITSTSLSSTKIARLSALLSNGEALVTDANHSAAEQLAIWEIVNEGSGTYNLTAGDLKVSNISSSAVSLANTYLSNITSETWTADPTLSLAVLQAPNNQTQLVWGTSANKVLGAVPEPATWAMMIGGFGAIGATLRRRGTANGLVSVR
ncbi:PEPxxWA-CTERM sorting domain-containing protein [Sphingomonas sp. BIUV-7]|uniref:PEPxxWA-CTERM sorting domain-containing protein n=1 Tax=Sphingomonas natans TaxID=3063330 RepID=A0ABT8YBI4_9SPHN|nr:PEPxxWA-CTERM sorting domain-containing protein [Sphingomonas sp. BIUV-7]MDO6415697.1 PEPxxWA-CTERM sorting domain-containing protein [Sphingomonas sp. BIUV-7]